MVSFAEKFANRKPSFGRAYLIGKDKAVFSDPSGHRVGVDEGEMSATFVISEEVPDRVGDVVSIAGIELENFAKNPIGFYSHQEVEGFALPIGKWENRSGQLTVIKKAKRALGTLFFSQKNREAAQIFELVLEDILRTCSIGFNPLKEPVHRSIRDPNPNSIQVGMYFPSIDLLEVSVTGVPCAPTATLVRSYLSRGRIAGEPISTPLRKSLEPLAEQKTTQVTSGFAPAPSASAQSVPSSRSKRPMSKKWGKPGRGKRQKHIRHEASRPEGHQWVLYSHDMSKVLGTHPTEEAAKEQEAAIKSSEHGKAMSASSGTAGGYAVSEENAQQPDHERIKGEITAVMGGHGDGHACHYKSETGEVHHEHPEGADEESLKATKDSLEGIEGVSAVHQAPSAPEGEGYEKLFPPPAEAEHPKETAPADNAPEEKLKAEYTRKAQLAFHVGRGKAYRAMAKMLPKKKKDALEECVHHKIPKIAEDHPEMAEDQRTAVAYSMCGEKAFGHDAYENKEGAEQETLETPEEYAPGIPADTEDNKQPPSLTLCQQTIENIEAALPGMEPETREFWEHILQEIRDHGMERYPQENFGGEETKDEPTTEEAQEFAGEVTDAYRETPEQREERESKERLQSEREAEKRAQIQLRKSMRILRKGDHPDILRASADHHHAMSKKSIGSTHSKADREASEQHGRAMDRLHGAVTAYMKAKEEEPDEREMEEATGTADNPVPEAPDPEGTDDEAPAEVEKLFAAAVEKAVGNDGATADVLKRLDAVSERFTSIYGTRF